MGSFGQGFLGSVQMRKTAVVSILVALLLLASCRMDVNLNGGNDTVYADSKNWMSRLPDDILFRDITIPATHDSCANRDLLGLPSISSNQDLSLGQQLEAGVRCIDIRITEKGDGYGIYHGPVFMKMMLSDVVDVCRAFLQENPSEFILMFINYENGHHRLATPVIADLRDSDADLFFQGGSLSGVKLEDIRGKIIPAEAYIRIYGEPELVSTGDFWVPDFEYDIDEESFWKTDDPRIILDYVSDVMEMVRTGDRHYPDDPAVYTTASYLEGQFGLPNYRIVSSYVNPRIQDYLKPYEGTGSYFGIIKADHMTHELAHAIYCCNILN